MPTTQQGTSTEAGVVLGVDTHLDVHVTVALDRLGRRLDGRFLPARLALSGSNKHTHRWLYAPHARSRKTTSRRVLIKKHPAFSESGLDSKPWRMARSSLGRSTCTSLRIKRRDAECS